ncbi:MAG: hypothetical protein WKG07_13150 [Hymenobacter sp.]
MCTAILDRAAAHRAEIGFSAFVSLGNKAEVTESDLLEAWAEDTNTSVVLGYLEGISDGPRFLRAASAISRQKPFVLIKSGVSLAGADAVSSHTGTLTGSDDVLNAALKTAGVTRATTIEELLDYTAAFADHAAASGNWVAIVTNAGGPAGADHRRSGSGRARSWPSWERRPRTCYAKPCRPKPTSTTRSIASATPGPTATSWRLAVLNDRNVDSVIVPLTPQAMTEITETAEVLVRAATGNRQTGRSRFHRRGGGGIWFSKIARNQAGGL